MQDGGPKGYPPPTLIHPQFEEMSLKYTGATFVKVDVDEMQAVAEKVWMFS
jgi:hypothetical protein